MKKRTVIIPAAGLSSRMGNFKPLLSFGRSTVLGTIIDVLKAAGVDEIIIVTGHNAARIEKETKDKKVTLVHNQHYETSHMFDSVLLGLGARTDAEDGITGIWPVDVPAVDTETVKALFACIEGSSYEAVIPVHNGEDGHPVLFSAEAARVLATHDGQMGLAGAIKKLEKIRRIEVPDPFVLVDMDTPKEYEELRRQTGQPAGKLDFSIKVSLKKEFSFFSFGLVELLVLTDRYQSLRRACEEMGMSYSKGWSIIRTAETESGIKFLDKQIGGIGGGGSSLTEEGKDFLKRYNTFCEEINMFATDIFSKYFDKYQGGKE